VTRNIVYIYYYIFLLERMQSAIALLLLRATKSPAPITELELWIPVPGHNGVHGGNGTALSLHANVHRLRSHHLPSLCPSLQSNVTPRLHYMMLKCPRYTALHFYIKKHIQTTFLEISHQYFALKYLKKYVHLTNSPRLFGIIEKDKFTFQHISLA
jgi:hypothetical protein